MSIPFTYVYDWGKIDGDWLPVFEAFAANGAKHLVFTEDMVNRIASHAPFRRTLAQYMEQNKLDFVDGHTPFEAEATLVATDEIRPQMLLRQKFALQLMADFGVKNCCVHVGRSFEYPNMTFADADINARKALDELVPFAQKLGVVICIENIFNPINHLQELHALMQDYRCDNFGFCYDCGHANIMENGTPFDDCIMYARWGMAGKKPEEIQWEKDTLNQMLPDIVMCHLHDNDARRDQHTLPGRGNIDFAREITTLRKAPRLTTFQSEVMPIRNDLSVAELCSTWQDLMIKY